MNKKIIIDIETCSLSKEELAKVKPEFKANGTLKDPEKIKADLINKESQWYEQCALSACTGKIMAIGFLEDDIKLFHGIPEIEMLNIFWDIYDAGDSFIGHYIKGFDIPFIVRRSYILGVKIKPVMNGRYLNSSFLDTMEAWSLGSKDTISLKDLADTLGVGVKSGNGAEFAALYSNHETKEKALEYLANDLRLTKGCAEKLGLL